MDNILSVCRCHSFEKLRQCGIGKLYPLGLPAIWKPRKTSVVRYRPLCPSNKLVSFLRRPHNPVIVTQLHTKTTKVGSLWQTNRNSYLVKNPVRYYLWGNARDAGGVAPTYPATMW